LYFEKIKNLSLNINFTLVLWFLQFNLIL